MQEKRKTEFGLNIGISSMLFIFIILCIVSFAVLSLASAQSDYRLSAKVSEHSRAYSEACNEAELRIANTDSTLKSLYETGISRAGYYEKVGKKMSFSIPISPILTLEVEIRILYPEGAGENFYEVTRWEVVTDGSLEYDDSLPVYK